MMDPLAIDPSGAAFIGHDLPRNVSEQFGALPLSIIAGCLKLLHEETRLGVLGSVVVSSP